MAFKYHYHEVLDTIGQMFTDLFKGLRDMLVLHYFCLLFFYFSFKTCIDFLLQQLCRRYSSSQPAVPGRAFQISRTCSKIGVSTSNRITGRSRRNSKRGRWFVDTSWKTFGKTRQGQGNIKYKKFTTRKIYFDLQVFSLKCD